ncbi:MAG: hypothetical protein ABI675_16270 [Chitinophagaceae bacterium]
MKNNRETLIGNLHKKYKKRKPLALFSLFFFEKSLIQPLQTEKHKVVLLIHDGAGTILKSQMTSYREKTFTDGLNEALEKKC